MRGFFQYFKIPLVIIAIMAIVALGLRMFHGSTSSETAVSSNLERTVSERVFDYGEVLTDEEEDLLREQIQEAEFATKSDIVLVTLNESLEEYAAQYEDSIGYVEPSEWVMVYADNFYDEHKFGYDQAHGDGVLFLDNIFRESDGSIYSWMSTSGRVEDYFSSSMIDDVLTTGFSYFDASAYFAYSTLISEYEKKMLNSQEGSISRYLSFKVVLIVSLIITAIYLFVNLSGKIGKKTVNGRTYVQGGQPNLRHREDRFINKTVTKTKIETSSSSGGGGHHTSSGGHSHGGGGHSR